VEAWPDADEVFDVVEEKELVELEVDSWELVVVDDDEEEVDVTDNLVAAIVPATRITITMTTIIMVADLPIPLLSFDFLSIW
jgi:hypothetical protein